MMRILPKKFYILHDRHEHELHRHRVKITASLAKQDNDADLFGNMGSFFFRLALQI